MGGKILEFGAIPLEYFYDADVCESEVPFQVKDSEDGDRVLDLIKYQKY